MSRYAASERNIYEPCLPILIPLVGLPGVGKSTLVKNIFQLFESEGVSGTAHFRGFVNVFHFRYDDFLPIIESQNEEKVTKCFRKAVVLVVDLILNALVNDVADSKRSASDVVASLREILVRNVHLESKLSSAAEVVISKLNDENMASFVNRKVASGEDVLPVTGVSTLSLIFLDDNNPYRSMRYEFYQLARRRSVAFLQLFFDVSTSIAKARDASRDAHRSVGDDVVDRMEGRLERPDPKGYRWERRSCRIFTDEIVENGGGPEGREEVALVSFHDSQVISIVNRILSCARDHVEPVCVEGNVQSRDTDRRINLKSILHQSDVKLRALVGTRIKTAKDRDVDPKLESIRLGKIKTTIFERVKSGSIVLDLKNLNSELEMLFDEEILASLPVNATLR